MSELDCERCGVVLRLHIDRRIAFLAEIGFGDAPLNSDPAWASSCAEMKKAGGLNLGI